MKALATPATDELSLPGHQAMNRTLAAIGLRVLLALFALIPAAAGAQSAMVSGVVLTFEDEPLPGVTVTLRGVVTRKVLTDEVGRFRVALPPGRYTALVEVKGFATLEREIEVRLAASSVVVFRVPETYEDTEAAEPSPQEDDPDDYLPDVYGSWEDPQRDHDPQGSDPEAFPRPEDAPAETEETWLPPKPSKSDPTSEAEKPEPSLLERPIPRATLPIVFWNSWLAERDKPPRPVKSLSPEGEDYAVVFDLAPYRYDESPETAAETAVPDPRLANVLEKTKKDVLDLRAYVVVGGRGLKLARPVEPRFYVRMERLRKPERARAAQDSDRAFFDRVHAARIVAEVDLEEAGGCAWVALSIWSDGRNSQPLDHVVRHVAVPNAQGVQPVCGGSGERIAGTMSAGFFQLLLTDRGEQADAALHVFDVGPEGGAEPSAAVMVINNEPYGWTTAYGLRWLISNEQGLKRELEQARQKKGYAPAIHRLTTTLFPDSSSAAKKALRKLRDLSGREPRASVLARLVSGSRAQPLPLGLLDDGQGKPLGASVDFLVPLPAEASGGSSHCVRSWTRVFPSALLDTGEISCSVVGPVKAITGWSDFQSFLQPSSTPAVSEGLLLLAHHAGGSLSFQPDAAADRALPVDLKRTFAPGSVAVLIACGVGEPAGETTSWLSALNSHNVDAAIVSPFAVLQTLGACFARHLSGKLDEAALSRTPLSIRQVFQQAIAALQEDLQSSAVTAGLAPSLFEFVLVGNPMLPVCPEGAL